MRRLIVLSVICLNVVVPQAFGAPTLQGRITEDRQLPANCTMDGTVLDAATGHPLAGAAVSLPDTGETQWTDGAGYFCLNGAQRGKSAILNVYKVGFVPFSLSITQQATGPFRLKLQQLAKQLVLDNTLHHLGDGGFSAMSQNAAQFRKQSEGPAVRIRFTLGGFRLTGQPKLKLGSIIGIDTAMAHFVSGSNIGVSASPVVVRLNGTQIAAIQVNGDNQSLLVPKELLNPNQENVLEIEAGSHITDDGRLDYDDMELMTLVLEP